MALPQAASRLASRATSSASVWGKTARTTSPGRPCSAFSFSFGQDGSCGARTRPSRRAEPGVRNSRGTSIIRPQVVVAVQQRLHRYVLEVVPRPPHLLTVLVLVGGR